ncbi:MAG: metallophosphoesterase [Bacteroidales bacterium]|nr:metallophosphoesterase [Bacteroidales bacterium]
MDNSAIDISKFEPTNVWFTADTHFSHEKIIGFSNRPFTNVTAMNEELIRRWNATVPADGIVFHLGDFCLGNSTEWNSIVYRLNGKIHLILGNHDMRHIRQSYMAMFQSVAQQITIKVGDQTIILNHNPFLCYGGSYRDVWQLFGHVHSGPQSQTGLDVPRLQYLFPLQYDVGVDNNDYRPVSFADVKAKIEAQVEAARQAAGLQDVRGSCKDRRIVFLDPTIAPTTTTQKRTFKRLEDVSSDVIELSVSNGQSLKAEIARRVSLLPGNVRYVYVGTQPLEDFRNVNVQKDRGLSDEDIDKAIKILL